MQGANLRGHGTRNGTSRENGCLDSGHEGWSQREDGGQSKENGVESGNDAVRSGASESPYGRGRSEIFVNNEEAA
jgi:hypothetical protein